jgi:hypothetical protein
LLPLKNNKLPLYPKIFLAEIRGSGMLSEPGAGSFRINFYPGWCGSNAAAGDLSTILSRLVLLLGAPSGGLPL